MASINKTVFYVILFSIAMGFMESAVVIYLREIFYPRGFAFPLVTIPGRLALVEVLREAATLIMLMIAGILAGTNKVQRFNFFCLAFAVWDLVYYLFLYLFLGWPQSLFTWDILFLIPVPWVGPVWAPCLISVLMLCSSLTVIFLSDFRKHYVFNKWDFLLLLTGALTCILSLVLDYLLAIRSSSQSSAFSKAPLFSDIDHYVPQHFHYTVFFCGFAMLCAGVLHNILITNKNQRR